MELLYKVVIHSHNNVFVSSAIKSAAALRYELHEQTKSETPIFVFRDMAEAQKYRRSFAITVHGDRYAILEGTSTGAIYLLRDLTPSLLTPRDVSSPQVAQLFWSHKYQSTSYRISVLDVYYGVYDFTPHRIVYPLPG